MKILVSACLLGCPCRYDGQGKKHPEVEALRTRGHELIPVCPEVQGGLPTPRPPAERQRDGRVVNREGTDVTESYQAGAKLALKTALEQGCERQPSSCVRRESRSWENLRQKQFNKKAPDLRSGACGASENRRAVLFY